MTSVMLVAFLVPLGVLAHNLAQERALAAGRQDAQSVAVFAGGVTQDRSRLEAALLAVNDSLRRTSVLLPDGSVVGAAAGRSPSTELAARGQALTARAAGGVEVLLPVAGSTGVAVVRTFVPDSELTQGVQQSWLVLAGVGALLILVTASPVTASPGAVQGARTCGCNARRGVEAGTAAGAPQGRRQGPVRIRPAVCSPAVLHRGEELVLGEQSGERLFDQTGCDDGAPLTLGSRVRAVVPTVEADLLGKHLEHGECVPQLVDLGVGERAGSGHGSRQVVDLGAPARADAQHKDARARLVHVEHDPL